MISERLNSYLESNTLVVDRQLGFGIHGKAFSVEALESPGPFAIKIFDEEAPFQREIAVFQRLEEDEISKVGIFQIPMLLSYDEDRLIIAMTLVYRPFCLDFASAYLDELPAYFPPFDQAWHADKENQFGSEHWPEVLAAIRELESHGIFQTDVSPSNIALPKGQH